MKKQIVGGIIILSVLIFGALSFWAYSAIKSFLEYDEFFGPAENFVTKVDSPISLEQARKDLKFSLPDEASDIYYAHYHQMIAYMFLVKFSAPLEVCKSHAIEVIQSYNENENNPGRHISLEFTDISGLSIPWKECTYSPLNISWFDLHNIKNGIDYDPEYYLD